VIEIKIGDITGSNLHAGLKSSKKDLYKIIKLTEENGELRLNNQLLMHENERLKQQLKK
jgi:hypothetical protein